jgi:hypothetical protein
VANFQSIAAAGQSLERFLTRFFTNQPPVPGRATRGVLIRTEDLEEGARADAIGSPALSIFLYRVDFNKTTRAAWSAVASHDQRVHLPLDLHYLLTPWAANAADEQRVLGCAMQCLEETPILSGPLLGQSAGWAPNEALQICLEDLPTEDVMRTFDSLPVDYKISVPYVMRVVRIDGPVQLRHREATAAEARLRPDRQTAEPLP